MDWLFDFVHWLTSWLGDTLDWILELVMWIPQWIFYSIMRALGAIIAAIPVPDWVTDIGGLTGGIPAEVVFFLQFAQIDFGLNIVVSAMALRWLISKIPLVGG